MENYTVKEVSRIMGVNRITVMRRIKDGSLRAYKEGHKFIIFEEDFNAFLEAHPIYLKKVKQPKPHQSDDVQDVDIVLANEAFNLYASFLKKLMLSKKNDKETINSYILPILENHRFMLDMCISKLEKGE